MDEANALESDGTWLKSKVRFSSLGQLLLMHSQFPTTTADAVFFGPDTYRFARALRATLAAWPGWKPKRMIDIGCGSGAGGFFVSSILPERPELVLGDINDEALRYAAINAAINDIQDVTVVKSDILAGIEGRADFIICNPPYLVDPAGRVYRNGGGQLGFDLALRILAQGISHLTPDGQMLLYTGAPVVDGVDQFFSAVEPVLKSAGRAFTYEELDPDVFGEELEQPSYSNTDRIAVVALNVRMRKKG
jgi:methylase of polypeptide subunit release factors